MMITRRKMLANAGRGLLGLGAAGGIALLVWRDDCPKLPGCQGCAALGDCGLPQARAARDAQSSQPGAGSGKERADA